MMSTMSCLSPTSTEPRYNDIAYSSATLHGVCPELPNGSGSAHASSRLDACRLHMVSVAFLGKPVHSVEPNKSGRYFSGRIPSDS